ncbi:MAG: glycosyltransferase family 39 protein [Acidobacteriota bacterium]|nr:glycosyltransferase family 39 protein [Acidobacteriota bacterium]
MDVEAAPPPTSSVVPSGRPGAILALILLCVYGGLAVSVDFPQAAVGIQSDEATYYMMGHSLAEDGDLSYHRHDLARVWKEFPSGPTGLFLKRGRDVIETGTMMRPPFVWYRTQPDPDPTRFYYGKSFIYPLFAAPFVKIFGTSGFLVLHALLLAGVAWCAFLFLHARSPATPSAVIAGAFVMATVVPVYYVWITPELFNFALGFFAYFCWLYKEVAPRERMPRSLQWLGDSRGDLLAAVLLGLATFSKPSNALLFVPLAFWYVWNRRVARLVGTTVLFVAVAGGLFAVNTVITGEWNYQGGERRTYYWEFPFQTAASSFDSAGSPMARNEAQADVILQKSIFWTNFTNNLKWYFVGRYSGLVAYFFPAVLALILFLAGARRRPVWQWLVLLGAVAQILLFVISLPYTWFGGGGSVGNRYFMGVYGIFLFLLPPVSSVAVAIVPWIVGGIFMSKLVLTPFTTSISPGSYADAGPLRILPVELSNLNDLPITTDRNVRVGWFGDDPGRQAGTDDPGFQIYFLDKNAFREADKSFWTKGESRAEFLVKTDRPMKRIIFHLSAGAVATRVRVNLEGRSQDVDLAAGETRQIIFALEDGFPYMDKDDGKPRFVWNASVSSSAGFVPLFVGGGDDTRFLGVRVRPRLVE